MSSTGPALIQLQDVTVHVRKDRQTIRLIENVNLTIGAGETVALVGESGSGKSVTSLAIMGLLPKAKVTGSILWNDKEGARNLLALSPKQMRKVRGGLIGMIFQEPMTSLNPLFKVGAQIAEAAQLHRNVGRREALDIAEEALRLVGIPEPRSRLDAYPFEMSGGMRQRVMIAMGLVCRPALLIADEPTTALDVTIQAQILDLLKKLQGELGMSMLFITHDFGVVAEVADSIAVMYAGQIVEQGTTAQILGNPQHPYTRALMAAVPRVDHKMQRLPTIEGVVPDLLSLPAGCRFSTRCQYVDPARCAAQPPELRAAGNGQMVRCVRSGELAEVANG